MSKQTTKSTEKKLVYLKGERSAHIEKKVNELGSWQFFKYLYSKDTKTSMKIIGLNFIMLLVMVPLYVIFLNNTVLSQSNLISNMPVDGSFLAGEGFWFGAQAYVDGLSLDFAVNTGMWFAIIIIACTFLFAGGFAVIRDSFWTGELVILKTFFKGIAQAAPIMLPFMIIVAGLFMIIFIAGTFLQTVMASWLATVITVILWILFVLIAMYVMMLFSVVVTHKQTLRVNMSDAWLLYKTSFVANLLNFILAFAPVVVFALTNNGSGQSFFVLLLTMFMFMMGLFYIVFVWQVHMMKTFRLYNPVEKKVVKKGKKHA